MVIICANSVKSLSTKFFYQIKFDSNIAQNRVSVADRRSYVVIICPGPCEKFTKSEIGSS